MRPRAEHPTFTDAFPSFLSVLEANISPMQVIQALARHWHVNKNLHHGLSASELLAVMVGTLQAAGIGTTLVQRGWKGQADIQIPQDRRNAPAFMVQEGHSLTANVLVWDGPDTFRKGLDRLLGQITKSDRQAAVVVFVRQNGLRQVMQSARLACEKHEASGDFGEAAEDNQMEFCLRVSMDPYKLIPTTLLFCDLFDGVHGDNIQHALKPFNI